jgi:acyl carrier protein
MEQTGTIESAVRDFVATTFWIGEPEGDELTDTTDLVDVGVVDSMNVLKLVDFIEEEFDFMLEPEELFRLTTVSNIADLIRERTA